MSDDTLLKRLDETLSGLKDFQHASVDRVTHHFLNDEEHHNRILVADEVGLGKTIIAKGIIARLLQHRDRNHSQEGAGPLRVIYICSNQALAQENQRKLSLFSDETEHDRYVTEPQFKRLAELALYRKPGKKTSVLELCTLTPGTSFSLTSGDGNRRERIILLEAVSRIDALRPLNEKLRSFFHANMGKEENFNFWHQDFIENEDFDASVLSEFHQSLYCRAPSKGEHEGLTWVEILQLMAEDPETAKADQRVPWRVIPHLRRLLAEACASHLNGDLFILDEFQRFSSLVHGEAESEEAMIASRVFKNDEVDDPNQRPWVLLLSATPFKALTTEEENEADESHIESLNRILSFLNKHAPAQYKPARETLYQELLKARNGTADMGDISTLPRNEVENVLKPLISRTERVQLDPSYDEVIKPLPFDCASQLAPEDVKVWQKLDEFSRELSEHARMDPRHQLLQFYLSAAWPLAFSTGYNIQNQVSGYVQKQGKKALTKYQQLFLPRERFNTFSVRIHEEAPNPRFRALAKYLFKDDEDREGPEAMLWVPPALPHYQLEGPFSTFHDFTKTLIFSAWAMVPRMMSALLSYESERRLGAGSRAHGYFRSPDEDRSQAQLIDLNQGAYAQWALIYPSRFLAAYPLKRTGQSLDKLIEERTQCIERKLAPWRMAKGRAERSIDNRWYLMALLFLDDSLDDTAPAEQWLKKLESDDALDLSSRQSERITDIRGFYEAGEEHFDALPHDLAEWLAWLSVGSPAVCATRALGIAIAEIPRMQTMLSTRAAKAFISLFNRETGSNIIQNRIPEDASRQPNRKPLEVARYCAQGGLQAMLEEYFHVLASSGATPEDQIDTLSNVLQISHADVKAWNPTHATHATFRCRYAVPLGSQSLNKESGTGRVINVREAFNSPFRPFVVTSTSVGQEGLDFHAYCREIVHWNIPSNPIDLEQREGRINRYQSLVVRKRIAEGYANQLNANDGWSELIRLAEKDNRRKETTDLSPHWHSAAGKTQINRIVPLMPLSRDAQRFDTMQRILSLYRLTFGQPGQEELARYLGTLSEHEEGKTLLKQIKDKLTVRLAPIID